MLGSESEEEDDDDGNMSDDSSVVRVRVDQHGERVNYEDLDDEDRQQTGGQGSFPAPKDCTPLNQLPSIDILGRSICAPVPPATPYARTAAIPLNAPPAAPLTKANPRKQGIIY